MAKILLKQFVVGGYQLLTLMWMISKNDKKKMVYLAAAATVITIAGVWPKVLMYWLVPLFIPQHNLKSMHDELMKLDLYHRLSYNNDSYIGLGHSVFQDVTTPHHVQADSAP